MNVKYEDFEDTAEDFLQRRGRHSSHLEQNKRSFDDVCQTGQGMASLR